MPRKCKVFDRIIHTPEKEFTLELAETFGKHLVTCAYCHEEAAKIDAERKKLLIGVQPLPNVGPRPCLSKRRLHDRFEKLLNEEWRIKNV